MSTTDAAPPQIALFRHQARIIDSTVRANLEGFNHEESLIAPRPAGSCANWILGHLVNSYEGALPHLDRERILAEGALGRYRRGSEPLTDRGEAMDFAELLRIWSEAAARIEDGLQSLRPDRLNDERDFFGRGAPMSLGQYLNFIFFHQAYHAGQLGLVRRVVGKPGAIP